MCNEMTIDIGIFDVLFIILFILFIINLFYIIYKSRNDYWD